MNWTISEQTITRNGIQKHQEFVAGVYQTWTKRFTVSETSRALVIDGVKVLWSRVETKTYEDGQTHPAYPMRSGFAEIEDVQLARRDGFVRITYRDLVGKSQTVEACIGNTKKTRKRKKVAI